MAEFNSLDQIFTMFTPVDLIGTVQPSLGSPLDKVDNALIALLRIIENSGRGVRSVVSMKKDLATLASHKADEKTGVQLDAAIDLSKFISFYSSEGFVKELGEDLQKAPDSSKNGERTKIDNINAILGHDFKPPENFSYSILLSKSPFFHPNNRNTRRIETFLNGMPATVASQLAPFMDVEFQTTRNPGTALQAPGLLKFLIGAAPINESGTSPNDLMIQGHQKSGIGKDKKEVEEDFAGMEMFTSPQTLVNPQPNSSVGFHGSRYAPVADPFRPFASLESMTVSQPQFTVGMFAHKKCNMVIKLHDRSRLADISDFIRPKVYTGVTVWMTYGWRAPVRNGENPYFDYINNNMLMREAYGIQNCSIAFDNIGQVTINLELFTKGVSELKKILVSDTTSDSEALLKKLQDMGGQLQKALQALNLTERDGPSKEIRAFQVIESAVAGEMPNFSKPEIAAAINSLDRVLKQGKGDVGKVKALKDALNDIYGTSTSKALESKLNVKERLASQITMTIQKLFKEVNEGRDPFLPVTGKDGVDAALAKTVDDFNRNKAVKVEKFQNSVVSFGKLFSTFAVRTIINSGAADELQIFFYNMNAHCGPISGHSVAEFPIEMAVFLDQYRELCVSRGGEKTTLDDFLLLLRNSQFTDNRAIGYGLRSTYKPYDSKQKEAQQKDDKSGNTDSILAHWTQQYGAFKQPTIEMYVETTHEAPSEQGDNDILQQLNYSVKDASVDTAKDLRDKSSTRIMRIHIYDKQTDSNTLATSLVKAKNSAGSLGFYQKAPTDVSKQTAGTPSDQIAGLTDSLAKSIKAHDKSDDLVLPGDNGSFSTNQQIKDTVSKLMPTIMYGANGTTIFNAALSSKADPLLTAANLTRGFSTRNDSAPNGSGELGIPLRVIPAQLTMNTLGCPLATMGQKFFIDFGTGTTLDNVYVVTGLSHTFSPGKFETSWTFAFHDAYGVYQDAPNITEQVKDIVAKAAAADLGKG